MGVSTWVLFKQKRIHIYVILPLHSFIEINYFNRLQKSTPYLKLN